MKHILYLSKELIFFEYYLKSLVSKLVKNITCVFVTYLTYCMSIINFFFSERIWLITPTLTGGSSVLVDKLICPKYGPTRFLPFIFAITWSGSELVFLVVALFQNNKSNDKVKCATSKMRFWMLSRHVTFKLPYI